MKLRNKGNPQRRKLMITLTSIDIEATSIEYWFTNEYDDRFMIIKDGVTKVNTLNNDISYDDINNALKIIDNIILG